MTIATVKISISGLTEGRQYDVDKIAYGEVFMGKQTGVVHLKRYIDKEREKFKIIVVPLDYVELTVVSDGTAS